MEALFRFLAGYETLIYLVLGVSLIVTFRWLWQAFRETNEAVYGLEHQIAMRHLTKTIASIILIAMFFLGELFITSFIVPDLPAETFLQTPTVKLLSDEESTSEAKASTPAAGAATLSDGLISETSGCIPGELMITSPSPGQDVNGFVEIFGAVVIQDLGFYKFEFSPKGMDTWATFYAGRSSKPDLPIGVWDTSQLLPGDFQIKLVATDNQGGEFPPCIITVRVTGSQ